MATGASGAKPVAGVTLASSELSDLQIKCKAYQEELNEVCMYSMYTQEPISAPGTQYIKVCT